MKNILLLLTLATSASSAWAQFGSPFVYDVPTEVAVGAMATIQTQDTARSTVSSAAQATELLINAMNVITETQRIYDAAKGASSGFTKTITGLNSKTLPFLIGKYVALQSQGLILQNRPDGSAYVAEATTLRYDPTDNNGNGGFSGGNLQFMDNLIGARGVPLGMDDQPPVILIPLTKTQAAQFAPYTGKPSTTHYVSGPAMYFGNMPVDTAMQAIISNSLSTTAAEMATNQVGDGVFVRPYEGAHDDMYAAVGGSALGANSMNYYANCENYHPMVGHATTDIGKWNSNMLSNILSNNQFAAVSSYLMGFEQGLSDNPYSNFGRDMASTAIAMMGQVPMGQPLQLTSQQITSAQYSAGRLINTLYPSLFANMSQSDANYSPRMVAVVTLPSELAAEFYNLMRANNEAIRQNWMEAQKAQILVKHVARMLNGDDSSPGLIGIHNNILQVFNSTLIGDVEDLGTTIAEQTGQIGGTTGRMIADAGTHQFQNDLSDLNQSLLSIGAAESKVLSGGPDVQKIGLEIDQQIQARQAESSQYQNRMNALAAERAKLLKEREELRSHVGKTLQTLARQQFYSALNGGLQTESASVTTTLTAN
ncbi:MAG: hypothetical protein PW734_11325 [Verrucomicrobium sp.]|nr:hypothetical protein [Verrucomicrobium sp.]